MIDHMTLPVRGLNQSKGFVVAPDGHRLDAACHQPQ